MKRLLLGLAMLGVAALLWGCPIYGNENRVCQGGGCYSCPDTSYSGACINWSCQQDSDCDTGYLCDQGSGTCYQASYPPDASGDDSSAADCSTTGCPSGYVCKLSNGVAECVARGGDAGVDSASPGEAATGDSAVSADASDGSILVGGCDAMPPALAAVSDGRMHASVRNPSCRIHGGAIVAGVAA